MCQLFLNDLLFWNLVIHCEIRHAWQQLDRTVQLEHSLLTKASCQAALISPPLPDSLKEKGVYAQLKEQTGSWLLNDTKNTTNPGIWHTESAGERWRRGQIKSRHVGSGLWLSSPLRQPPLLFLLSFNKIWACLASVFIIIPQIWRWETSITRRLFSCKAFRWTNTWIAAIYRSLTKKLGSGNIKKISE